MVSKHYKELTPQSIQQIRGEHDMSIFTYDEIQSIKEKLPKGYKINDNIDGVLLINYNIHERFYCLKMDDDIYIILDQLMKKYYMCDNFDGVLFLFFDIMKIGPTIGRRLFESNIVPPPLWKVTKKANNHYWVVTQEDLKEERKKHRMSVFTYDEIACVKGLLPECRVDDKHDGVIIAYQNDIDVINFVKLDDDIYLVFNYFCKCFICDDFDGVCFLLLDSDELYGKPKDSTDRIKMNELTEYKDSTIGELRDVVKNNSCSVFTYDEIKDVEKIAKSYVIDSEIDGKLIIRYKKNMIYYIAKLENDYYIFRNLDNGKDYICTSFDGLLELLSKTIKIVESISKNSLCKEISSLEAKNKKMELNLSVFTYDEIKRIEKLSSDYIIDSDTYDGVVIIRNAIPVGTPSKLLTHDYEFSRGKLSRKLNTITKLENDTYIIYDQDTHKNYICNSFEGVEEFLITHPYFISEGRKYKEIGEDDLFDERSKRETSVFTYDEIKELQCLVPEYTIDSESDGVLLFNYKLRKKDGNKTKVETIPAIYILKLDDDVYILCNYSNHKCYICSTFNGVKDYFMMNDDIYDAMFNKLYESSISKYENKELDEYEFYTYVEKRKIHRLDKKQIKQIKNTFSSRNIEVKHGDVFHDPFVDDSIKEDIAYDRFLREEIIELKGKYLHHQERLLYFYDICAIDDDWYMLNYVSEKDDLVLYFKCDTFEGLLLKLNEILDKKDMPIKENNTNVPIWVNKDSQRRAQQTYEKLFRDSNFLIEKKEIKLNFFKNLRYFLFKDESKLFLIHGIFYYGTKQDLEGKSEKFYPEDKKITDTLGHNIQNICNIIINKGKDKSPKLSETGVSTNTPKKQYRIISDEEKKEKVKKIGLSVFTYDEIGMLVTILPSAYKVDSDVDGTIFISHRTDYHTYNSCSIVKLDNDTYILFDYKTCRNFYSESMEGITWCLRERILNSSDKTPPKLRVFGDTF